MAYQAHVQVRGGIANGFTHHLHSCCCVTPGVTRMTCKTSAGHQMHLHLLPHPLTTTASFGIPQPKTQSSALTTTNTMSRYVQPPAIAAGNPVTACRVQFRALHGIRLAHTSLAFLLTVRAECTDLSHRLLPKKQEGHPAMLIPALRLLKTCFVSIFSPNAPSTPAVCGTCCLPS